MPEPVSDEVARNRWMTMNGVRLSGVLVVFLALMIVGGRLPAPDWVGYVIFLAGMAEVFLIPNMLARKWRSPKE